MTVEREGHGKYRWREREEKNRTEHYEMGREEEKLKTGNRTKVRMRRLKVERRGKAMKYRVEDKIEEENQTEKHNSMEGEESERHKRGKGENRKR